MKSLFILLLLGLTRCMDADALEMHNVTDQDSDKENDSTDRMIQENSTTMNEMIQNLENHLASNNKMSVKRFCKMLDTTNDCSIQMNQLKDFSEHMIDIMIADELDYFEIAKYFNENM